MTPAHCFLFAIEVGEELAYMNAVIFCLDACVVEQRRPQSGTCDLVTMFSSAINQQVTYLKDMGSTGEAARAPSTEVELCYLRQMLACIQYALEFRIANDTQAQNGPSDSRFWLTRVLGNIGQLPSGLWRLPKELFWGPAKSLTFTDFRNPRDHESLHSSMQCSKMAICPPIKSAMALPMAPVLAVPELAHFSCAALYAVSTGCVAYSKVLRTACSSSAPLSCKSNMTLTFECTWLQCPRFTTITCRAQGK